MTSQATETLAQLIRERDAVQARRVAHLNAGENDHAADMSDRLAELRKSLRFYRIVASA